MSTSARQGLDGGVVIWARCVEELVEGGVKHLGRDDRDAADGRGYAAEEAAGEGEGERRDEASEGAEASQALNKRRAGFICVAGCVGRSGWDVARTSSGRGTGSPGGQR